MRLRFSILKRFSEYTTRIIDKQFFTLTFLAGNPVFKRTSTQANCTSLASILSFFLEVLPKPVTPSMVIGGPDSSIDLPVAFEEFLTWQYSLSKLVIRGLPV